LGIRHARHVQSVDLLIYAIIQAMQGSDLGSIVAGINTIITLAVGVCTIVALTRRSPPIESAIDSLRDLIRTEIGGVYRDVKTNHSSVQIDLKDHEGRISTLEGTCRERTKIESNCARQ
jgi:hypothetical protein